MRAIVLAIAICMGSAAAQEHAPIYWIVGFSQNGDWLRSLAVIDETRITASAPDMRRAWVWLYGSPRETTDSNAGGHSLVYWEYDCANHRSRLLGGNLYGPAGNSLGTTRQMGDWDLIAPSTLAESEMDFVCSSPAHRPSDAIQIGNVDPDAMAQRMFSHPFNQQAPTAQ
ncbi:MAG: surface-adhesin E family protein [Pseudomonadota bacterium]